jgi:hypothetical protein
MPKDWEVELGVVGDVFFPILNSRLGDYFGYFADALRQHA